jgi:hypothetical protein
MDTDYWRGRYHCKQLTENGVFGVFLGEYRFLDVPASIIRTIPTELQAWTHRFYFAQCLLYLIMPNKPSAIPIPQVCRPHIASPDFGFSD